MDLHIAGTARALPTSAGTTLKVRGGRGAFAIAAIVALTGLSACGSDKSPTAEAATTTAAVAQEAPVPAGPTVKVSLSEKSDTAYVLSADQSTVKAGHVTFKVTDNGKKDHETVLLKLDGTTAFDKLAIDSSTNRVGEDSNVAETGDPDLTPGETRSFSADLTPGTYVLVCNIEKHYGLGMRSLLTVTP
jgi:uncharacterized cupredoxin-like copper-binding protein